MSTPITTMSAKGQVVVPRNLRDRQDFDTETSLRVDVQDGGVRIARRSGWARATAGQLASSVLPMTPVSVEEIDAAADLAATEDARKRWGSAS